MLLEASPFMGALVDEQGTHFRVWAPKIKSLAVESDREGKAVHLPLNRVEDGFFEGVSTEIRDGDLYHYRLDGKQLIPDPASRYQPCGVHGPSQVVDPKLFSWTDTEWKGISPEQLVIYELHVGTFSSEGTFNGVREKLGALRDLGITAIELMPVADFPGVRNWGYDGVSVYAPARCYGTPDELRQLVDAAHKIGLAIILDVVYNHLGPDGNYLGFLSDSYSSNKYKTTWGDALNFDGKESHNVREFFIQSAMTWLTDYHFDGLRFDATHAIFDRGQRHFLAELSDRCRAAVQERQIVLIAEDNRYERKILTPTTEGGWGMDAVWADDFHHHIRRRLAGDHEGYYKDYSGSLLDIAMTLRSGRSIPPRADSIRNTQPHQFVLCLQNHDQVGNRAFGERLNHQIDAASYRAASTLLVLSPYIPLLFMGQEWGASTPFLYFADHNEALGKLVVQGRRDEFKNFSQFNNPKIRERIPSPQSPETFLESRLNWDELDEPPHAALLRFYQALLHLRRTEPALQISDRSLFSVETSGPSIIVLRRNHPSARTIYVIVALNEKAEINFSGMSRDCLLSTEDVHFCAHPLPPTFENDQPGNIRIRFHRPGALVYAVGPTRSSNVNGNGDNSSLMFS